jgi:hypothetical protein
VISQHRVICRDEAEDAESSTDDTSDSEICEGRACKPTRYIMQFIWPAPLSTIPMQTQFLTVDGKIKKI